MKKFELWYPLKNPFLRTQGFGENLVPLYKEMGLLGHNGWDVIGNYGQSIRASHDGVVVFSGEDSSAGLGVVIRTEEKYEYKNEEVYFKSIYWHLKPGSIRVKAGQIVKVGDVLAEADTTGTATASHLHFGLKPVKQGEADWVWDNVEQNNGYRGAIDPAPYWNDYYAEDTKIVMATFNQIIEILKQILGLLKGR